MKNIKILLSLMLMLSVGLVSCDDDYAQPPVILPEGGIGDGSWEHPMTAYQALLGSVNENYPTPWVKGYIVGYINTNVSNSLSANTAEFNASNAVQTNMLIAMDPKETNWENCATVQLPSGDVRNALNLGSHPENLGKLVCVRGTTGDKYCSAYGVRSVSEYNWGEIGIEPPIAEYNFMSGMNGFVFEQGNPVTEGFETWKLSEKYGFVATGGNSTSGAAIDTDAWAISSEIEVPEVELKENEIIGLQIHSAANYFNTTEDFSQMCHVCVREIGATEWTELVLPNPPVGNSWNFSNSGYVDISEFVGKTIQVGFHYTSTTSISGTWEIDRMDINRVEIEEETDGQ